VLLLDPVVRLRYFLFEDLVSLLSDDVPDPWLHVLSRIQVRELSLVLLFLLARRPTHFSLKRRPLKLVTGASNISVVC
jgi:hypothetical protein